MRRGVLALVLAGCNSLFGIHDLPAADAPIAPDAPQCALDTDCPIYEYCDGGTCACVAGYSAVGSACAWSRLIADPGFMTTTAWTTGPLTTINTQLFGSGQLDPGYAETPFAANNNTPVATVAQTYAMPRLSRADQFVEEVSLGVDVEAVSGLLGLSEADVVAGAALGVGARWTDGAATVTATGNNDPTVWSVTRTCVGAAQYAPESGSGAGADQTIELDLTSLQNGGIFGATASGIIAFDHVDLVQAMPGECLAPGTVENGSAEGSDGWVFGATAYTASDGASAGYAAGQGENGSRAIALAFGEACDSASATTPVSVQAGGSGGAAAISIYHRSGHGQSATALLASIGGEQLPLSGDAGGVVDRFCLPAPQQGVVTTATVSLAGITGEPCGSAFAVQGYVDDVAVAIDPACVATPGIVDPGFESGLPLLDASAPAGASATVVAGSDAPEGSHYLELAEGGCTAPSWVAQVITPDYGSAAGPALTFVYRVSNGMLYGGGVTGQSATWTPATACLSPIAPGRAQGVSFATAYASCTNGMANTIADVDELAVTTSASCPSQ